MIKLVSIIMPAYNAGEFIKEAVSSVLLQEYTNWELIIINDGSTDDTEAKVLDFDDSRIKYYKQENGGVSSARNLGLMKMSGDFFCFLDADDMYSEKSISSRVHVFEDNDLVFFVDGVSRIFDSGTGKTLRFFKPKFKGRSTESLLALSDRCFFGPTWMIRVIDHMKYTFIEGQTHSEDITFFLSLSGLGEYSYTNEHILDYRTGHGSAMDDLRGLEKGYLTYLSEAKRLFGNRKLKLAELRLRIVKIMFLSYLAHGDYGLAIKVLRRIFI